MWFELFDKAVSILDSASIDYTEWTFGGGTALSFYFKHRESKDIDIFLTDAQYIPFLSPRLNKVAEKMVHDYTEASNFVKLRFLEGEVDFIVAPHLTENYYNVSKIRERKVRIETPEEIIIKKLFYRSESLKVRDVLDTAVVYREENSKLRLYYLLIYSKIDLLEHRWKKLKLIYPEEVNQIKILDESLIAQAPVLFEQFLTEVREAKSST